MRYPQSRESGSAVLEFLIIGVLVLVPLLYALLTVLRVESAMMASTQAVREAGRAFVLSDTATQGRQSALTAARLALADQGFVLPEAALRITCIGACLAPGTTAHIRLDWRVDLPWVPPFALDDAGGYPITVDSELRVDSYRSDVPV